MTTLGAVFRPHLPPERLRAAARTADEVGLEELWLWEDCFLAGGLASAAAALASTERVRIGVGVLPVPLRNVALTAMEVSALSRLFGDRFVLGVGHGVQDWMGQVGARVGSPLTLLREYVEALRGLLAGERLSVQGRYVTLDDVALDHPPAVAPRIYAAATGPKTLRLVGEVADGVVLEGNLPPEGVRRARQLVDEGAAAAGRTDRVEIVAYMPAATGPDAEARLRAEFARFDVDVTGVGAAGDAATVAAAVGRLAEAGADTVVLVPTTDLLDVEGFIRFTAEQVRPLVG